MLSPAEKAYCEALLALKRKDYAAALGHFDQAAPAFAESKEFNLYRETTRLLLAVKDKLAGVENKDKNNIKESSSHGEKAKLRG